MDPATSREKVFAPRSLSVGAAPSQQGLVTGTLKFARAYSEVDLNRTERLLEEELRRESRVPPPQFKIARLRRRGEQVLHSKHVLLLIVVLNLVDCALVLGELVLDINYIKELREASELSSQTFINNMEGRYPDALYNHHIDDMESLYGKLYQAECSWNSSRATQPLNYTLLAERSRVLRSTNENTVSRNKGPAYTVNNESRDSESSSANTQGNTSGSEYANSIWVEIAHGLHKASITILGILFVENIFKLIFMGRAFFNKRLEVFDAVVVVTSFTIDLVFLKGLTGYKVQEALLILSFLLPWRVIRVVNSLIVAVLDHEHFRLKMLYQEKKRIAAELEMLREKDKKWDFHLQKIEQFCESEGIPKWKIRQHTAMGRKQSTITSMASLALNGLLAGMMTGPEDNKLFARSMGVMSTEIAASLEMIAEDEPPQTVENERILPKSLTDSNLDDKTLDKTVNSVASEKNNNRAGHHRSHEHLLHTHHHPRGNKRVSFDDVEKSPLLRNGSADDSVKSQTSDDTSTSNATSKICDSKV